VFLVDAEGVLATPPHEKVLHGVTRSSILELARAEGLVAQERKIRPEALVRADEVFLTGTTAGVWPVESVDGEKIARGAPGPVSTRLAARFRAVTHGEDPAFAHWLTPVNRD
jgi:branched-chain amino acid aminotransferase